MLALRIQGLAVVGAVATVAPRSSGVPVRSRRTMDAPVCRKIGQDVERGLLLEGSGMNECRSCGPRLTWDPDWTGVPRIVFLRDDSPAHCPPDSAPGSPVSRFCAVAAVAVSVLLAGPSGLADRNL